MVSKRPKKAKLSERQFVLRLPEYQATFLDHLVQAGAYKSLNDSVVKILDAFISDLRRKAEEAKSG
jgi:Arc/MetJ-type ribon-helix-helix transcriptional regulator